MDPSISSTAAASGIRPSDIHSGTTPLSTPGLGSGLGSGLGVEPVPVLVPVGSSAASAFGSSSTIPSGVEGLSASASAAPASASVGTTNLSGPKSSAPAPVPDPIAGLSGPGSGPGASVPSPTSPTSATAAHNGKGTNTSPGKPASAPSLPSSQSQSQSKSDTSPSTSPSSSTPITTGLRQRATALADSAATATHQAAEHPAVQDIKHSAEKQVQTFREYLGRALPVVVDAEKRTGVDRVGLVVGVVVLYLILIPFNLLGLALPTTQLLTFLPPSLLAIRTLDKPNEESSKTLLAYFVVFGFVQFAESLMAGFLERRIPQYYTLKLVFLAYLIHPQTKGAREIHARVLRPLLAKSQDFASGQHQHQRQRQGQNKQTSTPPSTSARSSDSAQNSPSASASASAPGYSISAEQARVQAQALAHLHAQEQAHNYAQANVNASASAAGGPNLGGDVNVPFSRAAGFSGTGPSASTI